jgi:hypothetical protein
MVIFRDCTMILCGMHTPTLKIKEDIEFLNGINVNRNPGKFSSLQTELISSVCTLETNTC